MNVQGQGEAGGTPAQKPWSWPPRAATADMSSVTLNATPVAHPCLVYGQKGTRNGDRYPTRAC